MHLFRDVEVIRATKDGPPFSRQARIVHQKRERREKLRDAAAVKGGVNVSNPRVAPWIGFCAESRSSLRRCMPRSLPAGPAGDGAWLDLVS